MSTKPVRLQIKRDTTKNWDTASQKGFKPLGGEFIEYTDAAPHRLKLGDGKRTPNQLPWYEGQADWNQSDPTHREYIQNRTHYDDSQYIFKEATFEYTDALNPPSDWTSGYVCEYFSGHCDLAARYEDSDNFFYPGTYSVTGNFTQATMPMSTIEISDYTKSLSFPCEFTIDGGDKEGNSIFHGWIDVELSSDDYLVSFEDHTDIENFCVSIHIQYERHIPNLKQLDAKYLPVDNRTIKVIDEQLVATNQSDWNQCNNTEPDFIKNRTHYEAPLRTVFLSDTLYYAEKPEDGDTPAINEVLKDGYFLPGTYSIQDDDATTITPCIVTSEGSVSQLTIVVKYYNPDWEEHGKPEYENVTNILGTTDFIQGGPRGAGWGLQAELKEIKQLDPKYLPIDNETIIEEDGKLKTAAKQIDWNQNDETKADFVKNRTHYEENISQSSYFVFGKTEIPLDRIPVDAQNITFKFDLSYDDPAGYVDTQHIEKTYSSLLSDELTDPIFDFSVKPYEDGIGIPTSYGEVYFGFNYHNNKPTLYLDIDVIALDNGLKIDVTVTADVAQQLDKKYIPLELERGMVKSSLQTPNATALTEDSFAAGTSVAGCRGYYIKAIDFANKYLYLSKTQVTTQPDLVPRYIFATHFKNYEYIIKANGQVLTPIETEAITVGSLSFDVYKTAASKISVTYPKINSTEQKNRTYQFLDWEVQPWQRNSGQTVEIDCSSSIILQYGAAYLSDLSEFITYCQDYADERYHEPYFKTGYNESAVRGKHFYTINNLHYLTDDDVKGDRDATIVGIEGNRVIWTGDIGYDSIMDDPSLAFYDYSFMIPEIPNPSDDAINLKPLAVSIGTGNKNIGRLSFSIGNGNQALQDYAFVGGNGCKANYMDFSFGNSNIANGQYGAALGGKKNIIKRGAHSAAIVGGMSNTIESNAIRAFIGAGTLNIIKEGAEDAFVSGRRLTANAIGQTVLGRDNVPDKSKLFILGGGHEDDPINIFTVSEDGRVTAGAHPIDDMDLTTKQYVANNYYSKSQSVVKNTAKQTVYITDPTGAQSYKKYTSEAYPATIVHREGGLNTFNIGDPVFNSHPVTMNFANERYFPIQKTSNLHEFAQFYPRQHLSEEDADSILNDWIAANLKHGQKLFTSKSVLGNFSTKNIISIVPDPNSEDIHVAQNVVCAEYTYADDNGKVVTANHSPEISVYKKDGEDWEEEEAFKICRYKNGTWGVTWKSDRYFNLPAGSLFEIPWEDGFAIRFFDVADYTEHVQSAVLIQDPQGNPSYKSYTQFAEHGTIPMRSTSGAATFEVDDPVNDQNPVTLHYANNKFEVKRGSSVGPDSVAIMKEADKNKTYSWGDKYVRYYKGNGRFNVADPIGSLHPVNLRYLQEYVGDMIVQHAYPCAIIFDESGYNYFASGSPDGYSDYLDISINDAHLKYNDTNLKKIGNYRVYALKENDYVYIRNWDTGTVYVKQQGSQIYISRSNDESYTHVLEMDDEVTIVVGENFKHKLIIEDTDRLQLSIEDNITTNPAVSFGTQKVIGENEMEGYTIYRREGGFNEDSIFISLTPYGDPIINILKETNGVQTSIASNVCGNGDYSNEFTVGANENIVIEVRER